MLAKLGKITYMDKNVVVFNNFLPVSRPSLEPIFNDLSDEEILSGNYFFFVKMGIIISVGDGKNFLDFRRRGDAAKEPVCTAELFMRA